MSRYLGLREGEIVKIIRNSKFIFQENKKQNFIEYKSKYYRIAKCTERLFGYFGKDPYKEGLPHERAIGEKDEKKRCSS